MSELEGEIAVPQLALVMCLSLWAYYIQIKGGFTDRRQAPAPASNQTLPSGGPCGVAHMWPWPRSMTPPAVLQWSSSGITAGSQRAQRVRWVGEEQEGALLSRRRPGSAQITDETPKENEVKEEI